jgi:CRISPR-associated protein Cmr3
MSDLWLLVEPADVWLFRDARPFTAGESAFAAGQFPPRPATLAGALRTLIGRHLLGGRYDRLGDADSSPIRFRGPLLCRRDPDRWTVAVPVPADLLLSSSDRDPSAMRNHTPETEDKRSRPVFYAQPRPLPPWVRRWPPSERSVFWTDRPGVLETAFGWMDLEALRRWQRGESLDGQEFRKFYHVIEPRPGIRLDSPRGVVRPEGGAFYFVHYVRLQEDSALLVGLERGTWPEADWDRLCRLWDDGREMPMRLGGERRLAFVRRAPAEVVKELKEALNASTPAAAVHTVVLLTPAVLDRPDAHRLHRADGSSVPFSVRALAVQGGAAVHVGWDYLQNAPKPSRRLLPAGSVLVLETSSQPISLDGRCAVGDLHTLGYGWAVPAHRRPTHDP